MSCTNSENSEQDLKLPEQEPDEDVFESEESDEGDYQKLQVNLRQSKNSLVSNKRSLYA